MTLHDSPDAPAELPAVDERLIMPETRYEIIDGKVEYVSPADPPHATQHSRLQALLEAHVAPGFKVACDMLTRTSKVGDMAPDASVFRAAPHPETGGRQLERLAFEVVSTQSLSDAGRKAAELVARGVARVFAIDVDRKRGLEWSRATATWEILALDAVVEDPSLAVGLSMADVTADAVHDALARALIARGNAVILAFREQGRQQGREEGREAGREAGEVAGLATAVLTLLTSRGLEPTTGVRAQIASCRDRARLLRWLVAAGGCEDVEAMLRA